MRQCGTDFPELASNLSISDAPAQRRGPVGGSRPALAGLLARGRNRRQGRFSRWASQPGESRRPVKGGRLGRMTVDSGLRPRKGFALQAVREISRGGRGGGGGGGMTMAFLVPERFLVSLTLAFEINSVPRAIRNIVRPPPFLQSTRYGRLASALMMFASSSLAGWAGR